MGPESVILLDEMVLPDTKVHWQSTQIDLTMMAALASRERTRTQWVELLGSVGLEIVAIHTYTPSIYESIMIVRRRVSGYEMASSAPSHGLVGRKIQG